MNKCHVILATIFAFSMMLLPLQVVATICVVDTTEINAPKSSWSYLGLRPGPLQAIQTLQLVSLGSVFMLLHQSKLSVDAFIGLLQKFVVINVRKLLQGCDASILLDSTPPGEPVEKISPANDKTIKGLDVINQIKAQLEQECPQTVSCADILAYATREAVFLSGLPYYRVQGGCRDGLTSRASDVIENLPFPTMSVDTMIELYARKGFTIEDMVVLAGAHSTEMFDY